MRIDANGNLKFNSGFGSVGEAYGVRAWAKFDGNSASGSFTAGTNAGNMSSFTRTATGNFSLTMASAMPDTNYVVCALASQSCLVRGDNVDLASSTTVVKIEVTNGNGASFANADEITVDGGAMKVIIYKQDNGSVAVVYPNQTVVDKYGIDALAKKDVPTGKAYKIVDVRVFQFYF